MGHLGHSGGRRHMWARVPWRQSPGSQPRLHPSHQDPLRAEPRRDAALQPDRVRSQSRASTGEAAQAGSHRLGQHRSPAPGSQPPRAPSLLLGRDSPCPALSPLAPRVQLTPLAPGTGAASPSARRSRGGWRPALSVPGVLPLPARHSTGLLAPGCCPGPAWSLSAAQSAVCVCVHVCGVCVHGCGGGGQAATPRPTLTLGQVHVPHSC